MSNNNNNVCEDDDLFMQNEYGGYQQTFQPQYVDITLTSLLPSEDLQITQDNFQTWGNIQCVTSPLDNSLCEPFPYEQHDSQDQSPGTINLDYFDQLAHSPTDESFQYAFQQNLIIADQPINETLDIIRTENKPILKNQNNNCNSPTCGGKVKRTRMKKAEKALLDPETLDKIRKEKNINNTNAYNERKKRELEEVMKENDELTKYRSQMERTVEDMEREFVNIIRTAHYTSENNEVSLIQGLKDEKKKELNKAIVDKDFEDLKTNLRNSQNKLSNVVSDETLKREKRNTYGSKKSRAEKEVKVAENKLKRRNLEIMNGRFACWIRKLQERISEYKKFAAINNFCPDDPEADHAIIPSKSVSPMGY